MNTYVIHLPRRTDRLKYISELRSKSIEFKLFNAVNDKLYPFRGLAESVKSIIRCEYYNDSVLILEDDVMFHSSNSFRYFTEIVDCIIKKHPETDYVLGGASFVRSPGNEPPKECYFPVFEFSGTHCIVILKKMYDWFLEHNFMDNYDADISALTHNTGFKGFAVYPFVARAASGYSDIRQRGVDDDKFFSKFQYI